MRKMYFILLCLVICNKYSLAQKDTTKVSVQLPEQWKGKANFLYKLTRVLETHMMELDSKRICFDCEGAYVVKFYVSDPTVDHIYYHQTSNFIFTTAFEFYAYIDLEDSANKILHRLIITDPSTMHTLTYKLDGRGYSLPLVQNSMAQLKQNSLEPIAAGQRDYRVNAEEKVRYMSALEKQFDDGAFIKANRKALTPTEAQLWEKMHDIIIAYRLAAENESSKNDK